MALDLYARGRRHYGIKGLWEVLRWRWSMQTDAEEYKLRNDFHAYYARLLMLREPVLKDFFEIRGSAADGFDFSNLEVGDEQP